MNRRQKIITTVLWSLFLLGTLVLVAMWSGDRIGAAPSIAQGDDAPPLFEVPPFSLTNQSEQTVSNQTLRGKPWVAAFIFTRCPGPCPIMSGKMAELQPQLDEPVRLVSFTLDPKYDTPEVLREYGRAYNADFDRWDFLTGDLKVIGDLASAMKIAATRGPDPIDIEHGTHFVLINPKGQVHGYYRHADPDDNRRLVEDANALAGKR